MRRIISIGFMFSFMILAGPSWAQAETASAQLHQATVEGQGDSVGQVTFTDTGQGLEIKTELDNLPPGMHGFHIHENASCQPMEKDGKMTAAQAAGGHYDPGKTGKHLGPDGEGHKGDLPRLTVGQDGRAYQVLTVRNLTVQEIKNRAVIVHTGGDNYSDSPEELGGGGGRMVCGVIR